MNTRQALDAFGALCVGFGISGLIFAGCQTTPAARAPTCVVRCSRVQCAEFCGDPDHMETATEFCCWEPPR